MLDNDLLPLQERLDGRYSPLLADTTASILFTAGGMANWTIDIERGQTAARRGGPPEPTSTVRAPIAVLDEVITGTRSGVSACLDGDLTVRGNRDEPFGRTGFWDRLPALRPPALFVWERQEVLVPAGYASFVSAALPKAQTVVLHDCGHVPQFEHPEPTAELISDFLAGLA